MTEADLQGEEGSVDEKRQKEEKNQAPKEEKEEKDHMVTIALGVIGGIFASVLVSLGAYHVWKTKQLKKLRRVSAIPQELQDHNDEYDIMESPMQSPNEKDIRKIVND